MLFQDDSSLWKLARNMEASDLYEDTQRQTEPPTTTEQQEKESNDIYAEHLIPAS